MDVCFPLLLLAGELIGVEYLLNQTGRGDLLAPVQSDTGAILPEIQLELQEEDDTDPFMPQVDNKPFTSDNSGLV